MMDRGTLIRSYQAGDLGFILHSRHQYHWHTGYAPPQTVAMPHIGAVIAQDAGPEESRTCRPSSISGRTWRSAARATASKRSTPPVFWAREYGPFLIPYPEDAGIERASACGTGRRAFSQPA